MIKKIIKSIILILALQLGLVGGSFAVPALAYAQTPKEAACQGVALTGGSCDTADPNDPNSSGNKVNSAIATVINIFSWIVGVAAVIMVIIGGFKYITSQGDSSNVNSAKNTILYALIGLVVVALAQVIVKFVLNRI